jgi:hypothetical protein
MAESKVYTREECIFLSRLNEKAEKYSEMFKYINKYVELDPKLSKEERNILCSGYKYIISDKRNSLRILNNIEKRNTYQLAYIKEIRENIEKELYQILLDIEKMLDKYLIPNAIDIENKVFYLKLKADFMRYKCEVSYGKELDDIISKTEKIYKEANDIANKELMISNSTRLGLALNYSVFFYDIKKMKEEAINIAKNAFDDAMKILDNLEISKAKDTLLIIQMLKENLIFWCNEINNEFES